MKLFEGYDNIFIKKKEVSFYCIQKKIGYIQGYSLIAGTFSSSPTLSP
jgi:hypothetical protein